MTTHDSNIQFLSTHEACWEILPWYVNGTLGEDEQHHVESHLATCLLCRSEIESLQKFQQNMLDFNDTTQQDLAFARLMQRIQEPNVSAKKSHIPGLKKTGFKRTIENILSFLPDKLMPYAVIVTLLVGLIIGLLIPQQSTEEMYTTLSHTPANSEQQLLVHAIFKQQVSEFEIRTLLHRYNGKFIDGPTKNGIYSITLGQKTLTKEQQQALLDELRQHPGIDWISTIPNTMDDRDQ